MAAKKKDEMTEPIKEQRLRPKVKEPKVVESGVLPSSAADYVMEYGADGSFRIIVCGKASAFVPATGVAVVESNGVVFFALSEKSQTLLPSGRIMVATALPQVEVVRHK